MMFDLTDFMAGRPSVANLLHPLSSLLACGVTLLAAYPAVADQASPRQSRRQPVEITPLQSPTKLAAATLIRQGNRMVVNGHSYAVTWAQWQDPGNPNRVYTGISDGGLVQTLGLDLLSTNRADQQPVGWFTQTPLTLTPHLTPMGAYRLLDITPLAQARNWQLQAVGDVLSVSVPPATVRSVRQGRQPWGARLVVDLDRATPWQVARLTRGGDAVESRELLVTVDAAAAPGLAQTLKATAGPAIRALKLESSGNRTTLRIAIPGNLQPRVWMLPDPDRLVIDLRPEAVTQRNILWAPGLTWREQVITVGSERFPVYWLAVNPRQPGIKLQPIWSTPNTLVGTAPLSVLAQQSQAAGAINGGYFNRNNRLPLGAIRKGNRWLSSPILGRGAIAWNDAGEFQLGRLQLQETVIAGNGDRLLLNNLNSGFVEKGAARYTPDWGATYTPLLKNETILTVVNNQVIRQQQTQGNQAAIAIPPNGYLLVLRDLQPPTGLAVGSRLRSEINTNPANFNQYPNILSAGPLLLLNGQVVLNATAEQFKPPFDRQSASRSAIGRTASGQVIIAAVHNRVGGPGPTLGEMALILRQMGAVDALNLDGGSSTALYLGGQLLDRHPSTAARVHNGIGVFIQPSP